MGNREVKGPASASEVPTRPAGSGYNFRSRSRSATTGPKNRRLGSVETEGAGSTLDPPVTLLFAKVLHVDDLVDLECH